MIRRGTGRMYDYFLPRGSGHERLQTGGPFQFAVRVRRARADCIAAHANCLTPLDLTLLRQTGTHVVHCPKTHRFFHRTMSFLQTMKEQGINVCLGTDSMASNDSLSMLEEMRETGTGVPRMSAEELLRMATVNPRKR